MIRRSIVGAALLAAAALGAPPAPGAERFEVGIVEPLAGRPLFGEVDVQVEVRGAPAVRVVLEVDGRAAGERTAPPWRFHVDVGQANVPHRLLAVAHATDGRRAEALLESPAIRVDEVVEAPLRQVYVTATRTARAGPGEEPVLDLGRSELRLFDEGQPQRLVTFERGDVPLTAMLLIDSSLSMRGAALAAALAGARAFAESMAPLDEASVALISDRVVRRTPFAREPAALVDGLAGAVGRGGSAIHDHLYLALTELAGRQGRRVVILLSDGVDLDSLLSARDLEPVVGGSPALLYWIRLGGEPGRVQRRSVWRDFDEHATELAALARLVETSGGRIFDLPRVEDADEVFRAVLAELRAQYVLGYYPFPRRGDGSWREIRVTAGRPDVRLRTREGYFDDPEP